MSNNTCCLAVLSGAKPVWEYYVDDNVDGKVKSAFCVLKLRLKTIKPKICSCHKDCFLFFFCFVLF